MSYEVIWEMDAMNDRDEIMEFLFVNSGYDLAERIDHKIADGGSLLSAHPFMGSEWDGGGRKLVLTGTPYLLFYCVDEVDKKIKIIKVLHSRRRFE